MALSRRKTGMKKIYKQLGYTLLFVFVVMNVITFFHAYKFTHFSDSGTPKIKPEQLTASQKAGILFFGVNNPKPVNTQFPTQKYTTLHLKSNVEIECWSIRVPNSKGTIIIFHGYAGEKSQMIDKSDEFVKMGYSTLLVDFMGSGGSEGNQTTIGYLEAEEVKTCFEYLTQQGEKNIYLFGTSMGAVAILKAIDDYNINPKAIILECPFGTMYKTVCARFNVMGVPTVPMAGMLMFWGGLQNGFWAFSHNPETYAKSVLCPTLLIYGEQDRRVSREEIDTIYKNLQGAKELKTYPLAGHENYLNKYREQWINNVRYFLANNNK